MLANTTVVPLILTAAMFGQSPAIDRNTIWIETVQHGAMPVSVLGRGVLSSDKTAELKVPESLANIVRQGQAVSIGAPPLRLDGRVSRIRPEVIDGLVGVLVDLERTAPDPVRVGTEVEGTIRIATLNGVMYLGRPVSARPDSDGILFKLDPGGQAATRVKVRYGQFGHTPAKVVEIRDGLAPGDKVIITDMSAHAAQERVRLQ